MMRAQRRTSLKKKESVDLSKLSSGIVAHVKLIKIDAARQFGEIETLAIASSGHRPVSQQHHSAAKQIIDCQPYFAGTRQVEADCGGRVERIRIIGMQRKGYRQPADVLQSDCGIDSKEGRAARILPGHIHDDCGILAFVGFGDIHDDEGVAYATLNDGAILKPLDGGAWIP